MKDCVFCKIINKEIKSNIVYEDEFALAFKDINPKAPVHILVIPKEHIPTLSDTKEPKIFTHLFQIIIDLANKFGIASTGYRTVINCNKNAGQDVFHLHIHLLGGRVFTWPPG